MAVRPDHARRYHTMSSCNNVQDCRRRLKLDAEVEGWVQTPVQLSCTGASECPSRKSLCSPHDGKTGSTANQRPRRVLHGSPREYLILTRQLPVEAQRNAERQASGTRQDPPSAVDGAFPMQQAHEVKRNTCWQLRARSLRVGRQHQNLSLTHSCCANCCALLGTISIWPRYEPIPLDAASEVSYDAGS